MADQSLAKNFDFKIVDQWSGYNSANDKTNVAENVIVGGSQNMYKKLSGNWATRFGLKRIGAANPVESPVSSEFVWNTSWGATRILTVSDETLWVIIDEVWYELETGLTSTRYVFDKWFNPVEAKDRALFVHGNSDLQHWSGGVAYVASTTNTTGQIAVLASAPTSGGTGYTVGDVLTITTGTGGTATVTAAPGGVISAVTLTTRGSGYGTGGGQATTGGTGTGATLNITQVANNSITKTDGSVSWQQAGFSTINNANEKRIMIGGTEYTYLFGEDTDTIIGISPDPTSIVNGTIAIQSVITNTDTPAANFNNDFLRVINNQVYVGSYTSRLCYISSNVSFFDYVVPTPREPGDPELLTLDATLNGIGVRQGKPHISIGTSEWAVVSFNNITVGTTLTQQTVVDIKPVASLAAAYAHEFIDNVGDNLVYLSKDQQVRTFGDFNNSFVAAYPSLSQEISTELMAEDFIGGGIRCIADFTYLTAPASGKTYLYQVRQAVDKNNQVITERLWHSPLILSATRVDEVNGVTVAFSNANPQYYQVWNTDQWHDDSPSDEPLPYLCILALSYRTAGRRQGLQSFDKLFTEGYLNSGTPLDVTVNYNYQGATSIITVPVNSTTRPAKLFTTSIGSLGDTSLGDNPLGDELMTSSSNDLPKFKNINSLAITNCFEYQPVYSSDAVDAQWEILASGTNAHVESEEQANFLINKLRS